MFLGVVSPCHKHFGSGVFVDYIVHFVLHSCKEILCNFTSKRDWISYILGFFESCAYLETEIAVLWTELWKLKPRFT